MHQGQELLLCSLFGELRPRATPLYPGSALQCLFIPDSHLTTPPEWISSSYRGCEEQGSNAILLWRRCSL